MGLKHYKRHLAASFVIIAAVVIGITGIDRTVIDPNIFTYALLFLLCSVLLACSHLMKERIIRTYPSSMINFNFKVSVAQILACIVFMPFIMMISKYCERFTILDLQVAQDQPGIF